jgi:hypothetical protein
VSRISNNYSRERSRNLFNMLDKEFVGAVYLHQFAALVGFASTERGFEIEHALQLIISGVVWEKLFCLEPEQPKHRSSIIQCHTSGSNSPKISPSKSGMRGVRSGGAPPAVTETKERLRKAGHKEQKKKRKRFFDEFPR